MTSVVIAFILLGIGAVIISKQSDKPPEPPNSSEVTSIPEPTTSADNFLAAKTDLSLNGMDLGITIDELQQAWGEPDDIFNKRGNYDCDKYIFKSFSVFATEDGQILRYNNKPSWIIADDFTLDDLIKWLGEPLLIAADNLSSSKTYFFSGVVVDVSDGVVEAFITNDSNFRTKRGTGRDSGKNSLVKAYGDSVAAKTGTGEPNSYNIEYSFNDVNGWHGLLTFKLNAAKDSVELITIETEKHRHNADIRQAAFTFADYHTFITKKNYVAAYDLMTDKQKKFVGYPLDVFKKNHANTLISEVTKMTLIDYVDGVITINYKLYIKDRIPPNGTLERQFSGTVWMIKDDLGAWKIQRTQAQQISSQSKNG